MASKKVAIVTGSNKGIGFAIVRGLCKQFDGDVYLTSRNESLGKSAIEELNKEGLQPKYHQLDITDKASIEALAKYMKDNYGGVDVLVNNAAIAYKQNSTAPFPEQAEVSAKTNFWATLHVCDAIFPLLRPHARVVNVSSMASNMSLSKCSAENQKTILSVKTIADVEKIIQKFIDDVKAGVHQDRGWANSAYGMSKVGVTAASLIQHRELSKDTSRSDIIVNACCPGYVDTDMTSHKGTKTIDQGADTPLYLALLPPNTKQPAGKFLSDRKERQWDWVGFRE